MGDEQPQRVVSFGVAMKPSAKMRMMADEAVDRAAQAGEKFDPDTTLVRDPYERTDVPREPPAILAPVDADRLSRGTRGGVMTMKILSLSAEERTQEVARLMSLMADNDARSVVWWASLTGAERAEFLKIVTSALTDGKG